MIDLHVHSNASDGTMSPEEIIAYAKEKKLSAIALTDHDTISGISSAKKAGEEHNIEVISGIEFSTQYNHKDIHILGLFIDENNTDFQEKLSEFVASRNNRNDIIIKKLNDLGVDIGKKDLLEQSPDGVITRAHFAKVLKNKGYIKEIKDAFTKYIGDGCPAFVPRSKVTPEDAIKLTEQANGIAVLAHPLLYGLSEKELIQLIEHLIPMGLKGIEAIYSLHTLEEQSKLRRLARKYGLLITGGSDFHGSNKPHIDLGSGKGNLKVSDEVLVALKHARD
ncbi:hypothetical protein EDC19_0194 [Natranaerovirga hydrolytica]|uniref:Polymerase/histidinol phosphatase N-terminal domain-containing protein n=1 Tax=Natranaerovirga hydrolytica TaxID=680378 RepID=A0A4R1MZ20_9FIRM|nr:PHP domain-containing protein [Natranaerovirga hydrolytica]TCK97792.1 hypothetical protein EDC19_0194 [Natranaerovirga hydrolytica]